MYIAYIFSLLMYACIHIIHIETVCSYFNRKSYSVWYNITRSGPIKKQVSRMVEENIISFFKKVTYQLLCLYCCL